MCIIAIYKRGQKPAKDTITRMMNTNRDGVGIAWNTGRGVYFKKGFTTVPAVEDFLKTLYKTGGVRDVIFHARIGTSGGISAEKCHPFPLSADAHQLNRTTYKGGAPVVFHNGIFSIDIEDGLNDTQSFVKNCLFPLYRTDPQGLAAGRYDAFIDMAVHGSRLVIMYPDGFRAYGTGWQEEPEAWYSNTGYKPAPVYSGGARRWYGWDDDEFDSVDYAPFWADWQEWSDSDDPRSFYEWRAAKYARRGTTR